MTEFPEPAGPLDLFTLSERAVEEAHFLADLLSGAVSKQATGLIDEGFVVPAPETLANAAAVFRSIAQWPGLVPAINARDGDEKPRLDVVCALGSAVQNAPEQLDLDWASLWVQRIERGEISLVIQACVDIFARVNGGERQWLQAQMRKAMEDRRDYDMWRR